MLIGGAVLFPAFLEASLVAVLGAGLFNVVWVQFYNNPLILLFAKYSSFVASVLRSLLNGRASFPHRQHESTQMRP